MCLQVGKYRRVAQKLSRMMASNLRGSFGAWRDATSAAHVRRLRAQRMGEVGTLYRTFARWSSTAQQLAQRGQQQLQAAESHLFEVQGLKTLAAWVMAVQHGKAQRKQLLHAFETVLAAENRQLLGSSFKGWVARSERQAIVRHRLQGFVAKREARLRGEFFGLWQQYSAALQANVSGSPFASPRSAAQDQQLARRMLAMTQGEEALMQVGAGLQQCALQCAPGGCADVT